jgi:hypothetical protein
MSRASVTFDRSIEDAVNQRRIFASKQCQDFQLEMTIRLFYKYLYFLGWQKWTLFFKKNWQKLDAD